MIETIQLHPGVTLRCAPDDRFKQGALSFQFVRPMCREEAALNALLCAVLIRGSRLHPDIRSITARLDELYGASLGNIVRRVGDYQTTGLYCGFIEDRFAMEGDHILGPMVDLLRELLLDPVLENGAFQGDFVEGEKKNLMAAIDAERNDKRSYAASQMLRLLCQNDSFGIPRLGDREAVAAITPQALYAHYQKVLRESPVEIFYVGSGDPEAVAGLLRPMFLSMDRAVQALPDQTPFHPADPQDREEAMEITQGKLSMGFVTPITLRDEGFVVMQLFNLIFGAGMTSKLFMNVREKLSLCYDISSGYHGAKGIVTVSAGIDCGQVEAVRREILAQLEACQQGDITKAELEAAQMAMDSSICAIHDTPHSIEGFYATSALSGMPLTPAAYRRAVWETTAEQVAEAARSVKLHTVYFLKGVQ